MSPKRLGIPMIGGKNWMGGIAYTELLLKALQTAPAAERPECRLIVDSRTWLEWPLYERLRPFFACAVVRMFPEMTEAQQAELEEQIALPVSYVLTEEELFAQIDVYYPAIFSSFQSPKAISWIPDFQHHLWPEFFPAAERQARDREALAVLAQASLLVFSSQAVQSDFRRFFPGQQIPTAVLPFYSLPEDGWFSGDPAQTAADYELPERFFICCNQFWLHKNHKILGDALAWVKQQHGLKISLVCTGSDADYRSGGYIPLLKRYWQSLGVSGQIRSLGMIPRSDQLQLIRRSLAVVQPSLAEGWSTVVEDARALGKKMYLSDIAVHREQAPAGSLCFDPWDAAELGRLLYDGWNQLASGPDQAAETAACEQMTDLTRQFARQFLAILGQATETAAGPRPQMPEPPAPAVRPDIPGQLNLWGREALLHYWPMAMLAAELLPTSTQLTVWNSGIGRLILALQSFGFGRIVAVGHSELEDQFIQLLTLRTVKSFPGSPDPTDFAAPLELVLTEDIAGDWDAISPLNPLRILCCVPADSGENWAETLHRRGYVHQQERLTGTLKFLAAARVPWTEEVGQSLSPLQPMAREMSAVFAQLQQAYQASEADRATRLEDIHKLHGWLRDSETERKAQAEQLLRLTQHDIPALEEQLNLTNAAMQDLHQRLQGLHRNLFVRIVRKLGLIDKNL
jgi:hypothetical protein